MANKSLFRTIVGKLLPKTNAVNEAGGQAYRFDAKHALAQYAATGCLNSTFYASARMQLDTVVALCDQVPPEFIARTALFARRAGCMKDMPALLCAVLSVQGPGLMAEIFDRVIDTPKMLRNFVQIMRSGQLGRKSLGTLPKRLVRQWLAARSDEQLFVGSVGQSPSVADIVKMVHPRPGDASREALYGYLLGREHDVGALPALVRQYEAYKAAADRANLDVPNVPFQMLTALGLAQSQWVAIAGKASWQTTRMNLNTFLRHGVFDVPGMVEIVARRLADAEQVRKSRAFPYQLMVAYTSASAEMPRAITEALQDAMEHALANVPRIAGKVYVLPDVSGSMQSPVTGHRKGATSAVRCVDVAALVAAAVLRMNPAAEVVPFSTDVVPVRLNPRDSVLTNAAKLAALGGGGTNCSAALRHLNARKATGDLVVYVSDNQSWVDSPQYGWGTSAATETMVQWARFKQRNAGARMVCIDIQPYQTTQAAERQDILNVGGFSDQVFRLIADVAAGRASKDYWVRQIEAVKL